MHLQEKARLGNLALQRRVEIDHRLLDEIGRRALERRVHRHPLRVRAHVVVAVVEAGNGPHAAEDRLGAAGRARLLEDRVEARADPREPVEVGGDERLRLGARHAELRGQRERPHAVEHAEVDRLGAAPLARGDGLRRDREDLRRRRAVDVLPAPERLEQRLVAREMREQAQLDLGVVGGHEDAPRGRDEGAADREARLRADRDVLEVRRVRGEAPRRGDRLVVPRVDAPVLRDRAGKRVDVRALELRDLAPLEDEARHRSRRERGELLEHVGARRPRLRLGRLLHRRVRRASRTGSARAGAATRC